MKMAFIKNGKIIGILCVLLLASYLFMGFNLFRDYGATPDEINQIEAGHITWVAVSEYFGKTTSEFNNLPKLSEYYNRYYGQAATFPTVIIEAIKGFSMDSSSIIRLRHLWNFLLFFIGATSFCILTWLRFRRNDICFLTTLLYILTPRLFGDAFYNDRDALFVSLLWISILAFKWYQRKPNYIKALVCAFLFALSINTRLFGLILILLPIRELIKQEKKISAALMLLLTFIFWYIITPVFWGRFLQELTSAFALFATGRQRTQETQGLTEVLFFGKHYKENNLPFYYLPLWIFISTPLIPQILCAAGILRCFHNKKDTMDLFMLLLLSGGILAVMIIRPVMYNGWRHFYLFYVPIFWLAALGLNSLLTSSKFVIRLATIIVIFLSSLWTAIRIEKLHPYESVYLNPLYQTREGEFDRDYWRLSTTECLQWIAANEPEPVSVGEYNESLDNSIIGLLPNTRNKIHISRYFALHRTPQDYLIVNYSGFIGNEVTVPLYEPVYAINRDNVKLAEVFRRIPTTQPEILHIVPTGEITDNIYDTQWRSEEPQNPSDTVIVEFAEPAILNGLSLLPGDDEREYARTPEVSISEDGQAWETLPITVSGLFDISFPETETRWIRIRNTEPAEVHWSIRDIYFY